MAEQPVEQPAEQRPVDPIEDVRRKADDFARRQYEAVFKRFEQLLRPSSKGRDDRPGSPLENG